MAEQKARKPAALIAAEKRIAELEQKLKTSESNKDDWYKRYAEVNREVEGIHSVLDTLGIPRKKEDNGYSPDYPLTVRLFAWATLKDRP